MARSQAKSRLKRLERDVYGRHNLRCPECGWKVTIFGDVWLDLIVYEWEAYQYQQGRHEKDPKEDYSKSFVALVEHEHPYKNFTPPDPWLHDKNFTPPDPWLHD
jgi:hypothetical protein